MLSSNFLKLWSCLLTNQNPSYNDAPHKVWKKSILCLERILKKCLCQLWQQCTLGDGNTSHAPFDELKGNKGPMWIKQILNSILLPKRHQKVKTGNGHQMVIQCQAHDFCGPRLHVEDRTLTYNCLLLQIVTWMDSCLIGTNTTSSYIYLIIIF